MPVKRYQQSGAEKLKKKEMKTKPARHFQVGYIHTQRSIKIIYIYIYIYTPLQKYWNSEANSFIFAVD